MNPRLWQAIDWIGSRKASRFEWETVSGLPWEELSPYVQTASGDAKEVPDPDDRGEMLAVWQRKDGSFLLESTAFPAHREPIQVPAKFLACYRLDLADIGGELAKRMNFVAQPVKDEDPLFTLGFVQEPGAPKTDIVLFIPSIDPRMNIKVLSRFEGIRGILLIPTARWAHVVAPGVEVRYLESLADEEDYLVNVAALTRDSRSSQGKNRDPIIEIRQEDRWKDVRISFSPETGWMKVQIGDRKGQVQLYGPGGKVTKSATILGCILYENPPRWSNSFFPEGEREAFRRAFQRFVEDLRDWIPVNDGHPFDVERADHSHCPRFQCKPLTGQRRKTLRHPPTSN